MNRILRWTHEGWEVEPDQRHADIIVHELGLQDAKPVCTPGESRSRSEESEECDPLESELASKYRAIAARANYLAGDRTDIMYSVKEICRHMASPTKGAWKKLKRLGRYLKGNARIAMKYPWQGDEQMYNGL